ncbi:hypothetical protein GYMLUDRAFT_245279 [Collybiopsis luxurians FD-317 M1]|uniref:Unplaced genomic scaffold GYMLUscaffold_31, whole genome shotgun sequence n=1 Tax=Collybiopsis luxurians FD-317 M1 TaxID=944289 RepID=A0A0D0B7X4_9AGAR|nr:hypothetical protein GYMLUDRAFT_245279 [Collybiopsis luxurians FD-317 M1]
MPSLRRTVSSPAVRSSPYPTSSSAAQLNTGPLTRPGHGHRRSSGSETATRRVLADIEWWRVTEGQEAEAEQNDHEQSPQSPVENLMDSLEGLVSPIWPGFSEYLPELLTVVPQTPPRRGHRLESSTSSVESTPEPSDEPVEGLRLGLQFVDLGSDAAPPSTLSNEQASASSSFARSRSFVNLSVVHHRDFTCDYPDFTVSSLAPYPEISN